MWCVGAREVGHAWTTAGDSMEAAASAEMAESAFAADSTVAGDWAEEEEEVCPARDLASVAVAVGGAAVAVVGAVVAAVGADLSAADDACGRPRVRRGGGLRRSWWRGRETRERNSKVETR